MTSFLFYLKVIRISISFLINVSSQFRLHKHLVYLITYCWTASSWTLAFVTFSLLSNIGCNGWTDELLFCDILIEWVVSFWRYLYKLKSNDLKVVNSYSNLMSWSRVQLSKRHDVYNIPARNYFRFGTKVNKTLGWGLYHMISLGLLLKKLKIDTIQQTITTIRPLCLALEIHFNPDEDTA